MLYSHIFLFLVIAGTVISFILIHIAGQANTAMIIHERLAPTENTHEDKRPLSGPYQITHYSMSESRENGYRQVTRYPEGNTAVIVGTTAYQPHPVTNEVKQITSTAYLYKEIDSELNQNTSTPVHHESNRNTSESDDDILDAVREKVADYYQYNTSDLTTMAQS